MAELEPGVEIKDISPTPHKMEDPQGHELDPDTIDYSKGYTTTETRIISDNPAVEQKQEIYHFEVDTFYFEDGTSYKPESTTDPHIRAVDDKQGVFEYIDQGEGKTLLGIDLKTVIDVPEVQARDRYYEVEYVDVYTPYTEEELEEQRIEQEKSAQRETFLESGPIRLDTAEVRIDTTETNVEDLTLMMAEMIGV